MTHQPQHDPTSPSPADANPDTDRVEPRESGDELGTGHPSGYDTHTLTAARYFGIVPADVTTEQRRFARDILTFGYRYGS